MLGKSWLKVVDVSARQACLSRGYSSALPAMYRFGWFDTKNDQNLLGPFPVMVRRFRPDGELLVVFFFSETIAMFWFYKVPSGNSQQFAIL